MWDSLWTNTYAVGHNCGTGRRLLCRASCENCGGVVRRRTAERTGCGGARRRRTMTALQWYDGSVDVWRTDCSLWGFAPTWQGPLWRKPGVGGPVPSPLPLLPRSRWEGRWSGSLRELLCSVSAHGVPRAMYFTGRGGTCRETATTRGHAAPISTQRPV